MEQLYTDLEPTGPERPKGPVIRLADIAMMVVAASTVSMAALLWFGREPDTNVDVVVNMPTPVVVTVVAPTETATVINPATATPTSTPITAPTETQTPDPTSTPTASATGTPTPSTTPTIVPPTPTTYGARVVIDRGVSVNLRKKPKANAKVIMVAGVGTEWEVVGKTADGWWFQVKHRGHTAYMTTAYSSFMRGSWDTVPVIQE